MIFYANELLKSISKSLSIHASFVFAVVVIPSIRVLSGYFSLFEMSFNNDIPQFGSQKCERVFSHEE